MMRLDDYSGSARAAAGGVAVLTLGFLALRLGLSTTNLGSIAAALSSLSQFFTVLTNMLVMVAFAVIAATGRGPSASILAGILMAILAVGVIYHVVLAALWDPQGWVKVADEGLHTVVPIAALVWWFFFARKRRIGRLDPVVWLSWPVIYCVYALIRAEFSGFYPYPFLDLDALGWTGLVGSVLGICLGFLVLGYLIAFVAWRLEPIETEESA